MADRNRNTENYRYPQPTDASTPAGQVLGGTVTVDFGFDAGALELVQLELDIFTSTRETNNDKFQLTFPGPADAVVAAAPFNGDVNAFLADYFATDPTGQALAALGFDASFRGTAGRAVWSITIPGDAVDSLPIVDGTATTILPEGVVDFFISVLATDGTDTFYWGDQTSAFDVLRRVSHVVPAQRDVTGNGVNEPVRILDATDPNAEVVLRLRPLGSEGVDATNELIRTGTGATDDEKLLSTNEGVLRYGKFVSTLGPVQVPGSPSVSGVPVQGTTPGKKGEIWVGDDGGTPKLFVNIDGTPDGWQEATLTPVA
jgi:hypothetical protein